MPYSFRRRAVVSALLPVFLGLGAAACSPPAPPPPQNPGLTDQVRRLASILDYVAADYRGAVSGHKITSQSEYKEQQGLVSDAAALAKALPPPKQHPLDVVAGVAQLQKAVAEVATPDDFAARAEKLRHAIMHAYGVVFAPAAPPSYKRGKKLYRQSCVICHGKTGGGDGPRGVQLHPHPRSFQDPATMRQMSPLRAYNALTDGVSDSPMASFAVLSPADRWNLAFYLFTMRHQHAAAVRGADAYHGSKAAEHAVPATPTRLANMSDGEILAALAKAGLDGHAGADALAYLRRLAPYQTTGAPCERARKLLAAAVTAYRRGDKTGALQERDSAYLDGFEPHEASLGARNRPLMKRTENQFMAIRQAMVDGAPAAQITQRALVIDTLLDAADAALTGSGGARVAFVTALIILVREGLEGALLILLIFGIARRAGVGDDEMRAVHAGWIVALICGVATWFASGSLIRLVGGAQRELIEGIVNVFAAAILLGVSHFMLARIDAQRRVAALKKRLERASSSPRRRWVLASLAFVAVYRESFECVLFLRAIMLDSGVSSTAVAAGAAAGTLALIALVYAMARLGRRLKPGKLLTALGTLLCALAVVLAGNGVRALQEAGTVGIHEVTGPTLGWLGLYPSAETLGAQAIVLAAFFLLLGWAVVRGRAAAAAAAKAASGTRPA